MIKAAIIGLGKMGISHCAILNSHPDVDLVAVCDTSKLVLWGLRKYCDFNTFSNYKKMISTSKPDCIFITTPTKLHFGMISYALNNGIHVFSEKPLCLQSSDSLAIAKLAADNSLVNQIGYHNRFLSTFVEAKRIITDGMIGDILHIHGESYGPVVLKSKGKTWRSNRSEGGGCLYDYASHAINLMEYLVSPTQNVSGTILKSIYSKDVEDAVYSTLHFEQGVSGQLSVNWSDATYRKMSTKMTILGENGKIVVNATEIRIYLKEKHGAYNEGWNVNYFSDYTDNVNYYLRGEEYSSQIDYFIDNIRHNSKDNVNSFHTGFHTDRTIEMLINDGELN